MNKTELILSVALCLVGVWLGKGMVSGFAG